MSPCSIFIGQGERGLGAVGQRSQVVVNEFAVAKRAQGGCLGLCFDSGCSALGDPLKNSAQRFRPEQRWPVARRPGAVADAKVRLYVQPNPGSVPRHEHHYRDP